MRNWKLQIWGIYTFEDVLYTIRLVMKINSCQTFFKVSISKNNSPNFKKFCNNLHHDISWCMLSLNETVGIGSTFILLLQENVGIARIQLLLNRTTETFKYKIFCVRNNTHSIFAYMLIRLLFCYGAFLLC